MLSNSGHIAPPKEGADSRRHKERFALCSLSKHEPLCNQEEGQSHHCAQVEGHGGMGRFMTGCMSLVAGGYTTPALASRGPACLGLVSRRTHMRRYRRD